MHDPIADTVEQPTPPPRRTPHPPSFSVSQARAAEIIAGSNGNGTYDDSAYSGGEPRHIYFVLWLAPSARRVT